MEWGGRRWRQGGWPCEPPRGGRTAVGVTRLELQKDVRLTQTGCPAHGVELPYEVVDVEIVVMMLAHHTQVGGDALPRTGPDAQRVLRVDPLATRLDAPSIPSLGCGWCWVASGRGLQ